MLIASTYPTCRGGMEDSKETRIWRRLYQNTEQMKAFLLNTVYYSNNQFHRSPCENDVFRIIARITLPARLQTNKIAAMKRQTVPI
jgi:hypothetical protein